jgi:hypothetical protein
MRDRSIARIAALLALVVAGIMAAPTGADAVVVSGTFVDDNGSVHENGIEAVALAKITVGCNPPANNRFCPNENLTRAEAATFFARAFGLPSDGVDHFTDDNGHVLEGGINKLAAAGITQGCNPPSNTQFCPNRPLTRAEFAAFIARARNLPASTTDHFVDDDNSVLEGSINRIADAGITVGCNPPTNNRYCPGDLVTRAESATLLTRALGLRHNPIRIPLTNWGPIRCSRNGISCSATIETFARRTHLIQEGLFQIRPFKSGEEAQFMASGTRFFLNVNGKSVATNHLGVSTTPTEARRLWNTVLTLPQGSHTLVGEWRWNGAVIQRTTAHVTAG